MFRISRPLSFGASVLCCALLATTAFAGDVKPAVGSRAPSRPGVYQLEVYNGPTRTVRYFGRDLSPSELTMLRELERVENESSYVNDLQALKRQYAADERLLENHRTQVQLDLYGREVTRSAYETFYADTSYPFGYNYGYGFRSAAYAYPYVFGLGIMGNAGLLGGGVPIAGDSATAKYSLAYGVGPQGPITDAMAALLVQQATPEYAASVDRAYDRVALLASGSPTLRAALRLPDTDTLRKQQGAIRFAAGEEAPYTLTLRSGEKVYAKEMREEKDWYVLEKLGGGTTRVRTSEVTRIDQASGVGPAAR